MWRFATFASLVVVALEASAQNVLRPDHPYDTDSHTVALYHLDGASGAVAADSSGNGLSAEILGAQWTEHGRFGEAVEFGGDGAVTIPASTLTASPQATWEAWIWLAAEPQTFVETVISRYVFNDREGRSLYVIPGRFVEANAIINPGFQSKVTSPSPIALGEWVHVAATYDDIEHRMGLFVNGTLVASGVLQCCQLNFPLFTTIGRSNLFAADYFHGRIDEVRFSNVVRPLQPVAVEKANWSALKRLWRE